ncbi:MAG TPA: DUF2058 domain-containing protein [Gammaproteobacteria bacterium]|nr:DUF2058 domain-containing protein [Gammaproteobacteria bacterium]
MNNPFQEQLLKAGAVSSQQVKKVQQEKNKQSKKQRNSNQPVVNEARLKAQQAAIDKAKHDRELNKQKEDQARGRAICAEINQLILENMIDRSEKCDIAYNFEHQRKVKRIYINEDMKSQIVKGKLGIARIEGRYELVPLSVAEKIQQRNEKRIVIFSDDSAETDENDPYAGYEVPDDLVW